MLDDCGLTETQRVLLRAAQIVRERWQQGWCGLNGGPRCAGGALIEAGDSTFFGCGPAYLELNRYLEKNKLVGVPDFNDMPGRTAEEVATALESAAMGEQNG